MAYTSLIKNSVVRTKGAENAGFGLVLFLDGWVELTGGAEEQENIIRKLETVSWKSSLNSESLWWPGF